MPVVEIIGFEPTSDRRLVDLSRFIVADVVSIKELGVFSEDVRVAFLDEIVTSRNADVIVNILTIKRERRTKEVQDKLAATVGKTVKRLVPHRRVSCFVKPFDSENQGHWDSTTK